MNGKYKKECYIEICREQSEAIGRMIKGLEIIKGMIPENGKRFCSKQVELINKSLGEVGVICGISKSCYDNTISYLVVRQKKYSDRPCSRLEVGRSRDIFKSGVMGNRESLIEGIDLIIERIEKAKTRYESAPKKIGDFIGMYHKLYDTWKEVAAFDMPEISIDVISSEPPIF